MVFSENDHNTTSRSACPSHCVTLTFLLSPGGVSILWNLGGALHRLHQQRAVQWRPVRRGWVRRPCTSLPCLLAPWARWLTKARPPCCEEAQASLGHLAPVYSLAEVQTDSQHVPLDVGGKAPLGDSSSVIESPQSLKDEAQNIVKPSQLRPSRFPARRIYYELHKTVV